jgi:hypothetical protein
MHGNYMHFEILVEDQSGKKTLDILVPKIIGNEHTFKVIPYKGIGRIPRNLYKKTDPGKRILLEQLPRLLRGYGKTFSQYPPNYQAVIIVVADLDNRCLKKFRQEVLTIIQNCNPKPETRFCVAIEEGEAWLLGDLSAVKSAYPRAKINVLNEYENDSICGTWEKLADAIYPEGASKLSKQGWQTVGKIKSEWAEKISSHMNVNNNLSPSFCYLRENLRKLADRV